MVKIVVVKNGQRRACNENFGDYSCPYCNLVLHSEIYGLQANTNRRCNCGGVVSVNGEKTQIEKQESYSQSGPQINT